MKNKLLIICVFCLFQQLAISQDSSVNEFEQAKWSVGGGIGYDYSILGVKLSYHFKNNNFSVFGSGSLFPATTIGAEYTFAPIDKNKLWYPYIQAGLSLIQKQPLSVEINVLNSDGTSQTGRISQSNNDLGFCASIGTHYNWNRTEYFSIAASCRYSVSRVDIEEFNQQFNTNFEIPDKFLLRFTLAYNFVIGDHS